MQKEKKVVSSTTHEFYIKLQQDFIMAYKEMLCKYIALEKLITLGPNKSLPREKKNASPAFALLLVLCRVHMFYDTSVYSRTFSKDFLVNKKK